MGRPLEKAGLTQGSGSCFPLLSLPDSWHVVRGWDVCLKHLLPGSRQGRRPPPCTVSSQSRLWSVTDTTGDFTPSRAAFPPSHPQPPPQTHARQLVPAGSSNTCLAVGWGQPRAWQCVATKREVYLPKEPQNQPEGPHPPSKIPGPGLRAPVYLQPS